MLCRARASWKAHRAPFAPFDANDARMTRVQLRADATSSRMQPMTLLPLALLIAFGSFAAGLLGALTGLGGGIVVVPMLTLLFHVPLRFAIGASLVSVIATSSGAAAAYVREGFTNVRVGVLLE